MTLKMVVTMFTWRLIDKTKTKLQREFILKSTFQHFFSLSVILFVKNIINL